MRKRSGFERFSSVGIYLPRGQVGTRMLEESLASEALSRWIAYCRWGRLRTYGALDSLSLRRGLRMKVSIIIPTYNEAATIAEMIGAALGIELEERRAERVY